VINDGSIAALGTSGYGIRAPTGVELRSGGTVGNAASAAILGYRTGIYISGGAGGVANDGNITGTGAAGDGVLMLGAGSVSNSASGVISGGGHLDDLAAVIGVFLICPFIRTTVEPPLHAVLGFLPFFGPAEPVGNSLFAAILVLTIMVVPIIAALTRDVFRSVPIELRDGAEALGATRWEMIRGVVLPTTVSGVTAACVLGFGRAIGEAIAVAQIVGGIPQRSADLFKAGDTIGAAIATQFASPANALHTSALYYLAAILLLFGVASNFFARMITLRAGRR